MKLKCSKKEFEAILRRHFRIEELKSGEIYRLFKGWREIASDKARLRGQEDMFKPENAGRLHGVGWWEEFMAASDNPEYPDPDPEDHVTMYLSSTPPFFVPPRFHCPESLVGRWTLAAEGYKYDEEKPPPDVARTMVLNSDGSFERSDRDVKEGEKWCFHAAYKLDELWFRDPEWPHSHEKHILKWIDGKLSLETMDLKNIVCYWSRVDGTQTTMSLS